MNKEHAHSRIMLTHGGLLIWGRQRRFQEFLLILDGIAAKKYTQRELIRKQNNSWIVALILILITKS